MSEVVSDPVVAATGSGPRVRPPTRRGTELGMLAFAAGLVTLALVLVDGNQQQSLSIQVVFYGLAYLMLFGAAHLAVRRWAPFADPLILPCVALLNGLGLVVIHRLDLAFAARAARNAVTYSALTPRQLVYTTVGLALFALVLALVKDHRAVARYGYTCGMVGLVLLVLPGVLPSSISEVAGAKLWIKLGPLGTIQPGEFAKILLILFVAAFLVSKRDLFTTAGRTVLGLELPRARDLGPLLVAWGIAVGVLALEKELGMSLLFFGTLLAMVYVATERSAWVVIGLALFLAGAYVAYHLFSHVQVRVQNWVDPFAHYDSTGYQMAQSLFSLGSGGVAGSGLGAGRPDLIPAVQNDFIVAAIGEELGLVGVAMLLMLYLLVALRGLRSALAVRDSFGKMLGGGLSFLIALQVFIVVGGVTKLIPQTGLTAPFLSSGGSSLLANYILVALLLRISDTARRPQEPPKAKVPQAPLDQASTVLVQRPS
ncbi:FtsW/RodA/SpoVE family cell cycle protein [Gandjariella thermophila]|uniref:Cell division protein FtsW n=1 Tax=Gandjariella thermophila TaxID=1931992 RepID=A0A4D4JCG6_9PSEU|nr:FtsW/RodA/SpoVE family cell cycle protein [Gandjariella thermophila]GDY31597.1 cell division protein FtsW [Gandjariella thermophila]